MSNNVNVIVSGPNNNATSQYKTLILKSAKTFKELVTLPNTKYVIRYDFDLNGETITIPTGSILEFDGGMVSNGTLVGLNTKILNLTNTDSLDVTLEGTFEEVGLINKDNLLLKESQTLTTLEKDTVVENILSKNSSNGMGRIILKENITNGINTLTLSMMTLNNTIYVIQYDFTLGENITIPENCVLAFGGGSLNGTYIITGNETHINWNGAVIFDSNIEIAGTWLCPIISTRMFSDLSADNALRKLEALNTDDIQTSMYIEKADYDYYFSLLEQYESGININSNTDVYLDGIIKCKASHDYHQMINISGKKNINIAGSGSVIGDRDVHTTTTGEWGHCIGIWGAENINISGIIVSKAWGDGIIVGMNTSVTPNLHCSGVNIVNCEIFDCRRQGITIGGGDRILIDGCYIHDIEGAKPEHCIDIEPNDATHYLNNIVISNCRMKGKRLFLANYVNTTAKNVLIDNCYFESTATDGTFSAPIDTRTGSLRIVFQNNHFTYSEGSVNFFRNSEGSVFIDNIIELYAGMAINGGEFIRNKIKYLPSERTTAAFGSLNAVLKMYDNEITLLPNTETTSAFADRLLRGTYDIDFNSNKVYFTGNGMVLDYNLTTQSYKNILRSRNYFSGGWARTVGLVYLSEVFPTAETANLPTGDILFEGLCVYDATRNKPLWYRGSTLGWVDATGQTV